MHVALPVTFSIGVSPPPIGLQSIPAWFWIGAELMGTFVRYVGGKVSDESQYSRHRNRRINQMFIHHFLGILSPHLGEILLPDKGKPSCPLLIYSCNSSWQTINAPKEGNTTTSALRKSQRKNQRGARQTIFKFQKVRSLFILGSILQQ